MKKLSALTFAVASLPCCLVGCDNRGEKRKLAELERYSSTAVYY